MKHEVWRLTPVLLAIVLVACGEKESTNKVAVTTVPAVLELAQVDVATVSKGALSGGLPITGTLQAVTQTTVQSQLAAEVNTVFVREGELVKKGQILAHLATLDIDARLKQAQANLSAAKVEAELSRGLVARNKQLYDKKYFSEIDYQRSVGDAEAREENVRAQQAMVDIANKALNDASVRAPMSGIVSRRYIEPGSSVGMGSKLFDIVDLSEMELNAPVPAMDIAAIKTGQSVVFTVSGFAERKFEGKVVRINPVADAGTRAISVYVRVKNQGQDLKGGMFVHGSISTTALNDGYLIPLNALHHDAGQKPWVLVLKNNKLEKRLLVTGASDVGSNQLLVRDGLSDGEVVVVTRLGENVINQPARISQ